MGDAELEDDIACSDAMVIGLRAEAAEERGGMTRESADVPVEMRDVLRGDIPRGESAKAGEADREGALKGWNETEGRRGKLDPPLSPAICAARPEGRTLAEGRSLLGDSVGEGDPAPESLIARSADIGLAPVVGPT